METLIKGGHVIDPASGINGPMNVVAKDHRITYLGKDTPSAERVVDATGCYVFPGLIDFHAHVDYLGGEIGVNPAFFLGNGITATVDAGSTGCMNFESFYRSIVVPSPITIKTYLNAFGGGLISEDILENYSVTHYRKMAEVLDRYRDNILGLKYRYIDGLATFDTFRDAVKFAHDHGVRICVHTSRPAGPLDKMINLLEKDDVYTHMYHNRGMDTILDEAKQYIKPSVMEARKRGVIFDVANGNTNFSFSVALPAVSAGFWPDIISTDIGRDKLNLQTRVKNLPNIMAKFLKMGMPLEEVIRSVTQTPARLMHMEGKIGTLQPGANSDVAIFQIADHPFVLDDIENTKYTCNKLFIPKMTIVNGDIAFCSGEFNL